MSDTTDTETETETDTDEPSKTELHERVEQLESTVEKMMPSRRDALKLGAAGITGAAGLSATTQPAAASTGSAGDIGDPNNRPDLFADEIDANQLTGVSTGGDLPATQVGQDSGTKQPLSVSISNPSSFDQLVCIIQDFRNDENAFLRFNNDSSGNTKYSHLDNSGNIVTGTDRFLLTESGGASIHSGTVVLTQASGDVAIHNQMSYNFGLDGLIRITHFGEYETGPVSQIELQQSQSPTNDATLTVFGR
jgi:hypothetical protein